MARADQNSQSPFARELMNYWQIAAAESQRLKTLDLCNLIAALRQTGGVKLVTPMLEALRARAIGKDGWLAALQLWYISSDEEASRSFPEDLSLKSLIAAADFSLATQRAKSFFHRLTRQTDLDAVYCHLFKSLEGCLEWEIDSVLLGWLLNQPPKGVSPERLSHIVKWLEHHDEVPTIRMRYLRFLQTLPTAFEEQFKQAVIDTSDWLKHQDDESTANARTQYLKVVERLADGFDKERIGAAKATAEWLERHPDNVSVLRGYLSFLRAVPLADLESLQQASDKHYQRLIAKDLANFSDRFSYGERLLRLSRFDEAIAQFDVVLNLHKGHQLARRERAFALQKIGRMPEAETEFKHAIWWARINKQSQAMFHTSLGEFYLETKQWPDAINSFQNAQRESPEHFRNLWGIAKAQLELGNLDEVEDALKRALEDPNLKSPARDEIVQFLADVRLRRLS